MPKDKASKPKKPYAEFPLTAHANGQWCKKIKGKVHFFGIHSDTDAALLKYLNERDDLQAGRIPQRLLSVVVNVGSLVNLFLAQWDAKGQSGSLSPGRSWITATVRSCGLSISGDRRWGCGTNGRASTLPGG